MSEPPRPDRARALEFLASPNHTERRGHAKPNCVILHYTGMPTGAAALALLRDPRSEVSCHYFVWEDGRIVQLVAEDRRAWHAGSSVWKGERDLNSCSIGIEIVNPGHDGGAPPFPEAQTAALIALLRDISERYAIAPERVLAHSDVAPARKVDPGEAFPWERLRREGVGHWVAPAPIVDGPTMARGAEGPPIRALQAMLALYGYGVELSGVYDKRTETNVAGFQRHFRPARVDGAADGSTVDTLRRLLEALTNPSSAGRGKSPLPKP
jgi:N-acetylmuramoyl-L-alanine amidase